MVSNSSYKQNLFVVFGTENALLALIPIKRKLLHPSAFTY